jgi:drug/metabolite transporter (DMT)-like permease
VLTAAPDLSDSPCLTIPPAARSGNRARRSFTSFHSPDHAPGTRMVGRGRVAAYGPPRSSEAHGVQSQSAIPIVTARRQRALLHAPLFLTLAALAWAGNHVVARAIADQVPPGTVNLLRWLVVAALVGVFARRAIAADWPVMRRHKAVLFWLGVSGGGVFGTLQYVGLQYTGVVNMGILNSVAPAFIVAASVLLFRDPIRPVQVLGILVSLAGVVAMVSRLDPSRLAALEFNKGDLIILANMALFAVYSACLRLRPPIALSSFLFALALAAAIANLPHAAVEHLSGFVFAVSPLSVIAVAYAAVMTSIVAYVCWSKGVEAIGPARASVFLHLIPFANAGLGMTLFAEPLRLDHVIGFVLVLAGVALTSRAPPPKR